MSWNGWRNENIDSLHEIKQQSEKLYLLTNSIYFAIRYVGTTYLKQNG